MNDNIQCIRQEQKKTATLQIAETSGKIAEISAETSPFPQKKSLSVKEKDGCSEGKGCPICWERSVVVFRNLSQQIPKGLPMSLKRYIMRIFIYKKRNKVHILTDSRGSFLPEAEFQSNCPKEKS